MLALIEWLYLWALAPLGLYMLVQPPVRMVLCWLSLRSCIREANAMNKHVMCGVPRLRSMLVYAMHPLPAKRGPTYAWYGFGNWQVWELPEPEPPAIAPADYQRTDDSIFEKRREP